MNNINSMNNMSNMNSMNNVNNMSNINNMNSQSMNVNCNTPMDMQRRSSCTNIQPMPYRKEIIPVISLPTSMH